MINVACRVSCVCVSGALVDLGSLFPPLLSFSYCHLFSSFFSFLPFSSLLVSSLSLFVCRSRSLAVVCCFV
ncbi:hypothetical protein GGI35DRAFT_445896 [Trichoderma velutinum]